MASESVIVYTELQLKETLLTVMPGEYKFEIVLYPADTAQWQISFPGKDEQSTLYIRLLNSDIWKVLSTIGEVYRWYPPSMEQTVIDHLRFGRPVTLVVSKVNRPDKVEMSIVRLRT